MVNRGGAWHGSCETGGAFYSASRISHQKPRLPARFPSNTSPPPRRILLHRGPVPRCRPAYHVSHPSRPRPGSDDHPSSPNFMASACACCHHPRCLTWAGHHGALASVIGGAHRLRTARQSPVAEQAVVGIGFFISPIGLVDSGVAPRLAGSVTTGTCLASDALFIHGCEGAQSCEAVLASTPLSDSGAGRPLRRVAPTGWSLNITLRMTWLHHELLLMTPTCSARSSVLLRRCLVFTILLSVFFDAMGVRVGLATTEIWHRVSTGLLVDFRFRCWWWRVQFGEPDFRRPLPDAPGVLFLLAFHLAAGTIVPARGGRLPDDSPGREH